MRNSKPENFENNSIFLNIKQFYLIKESINIFKKQVRTNIGLADTLIPSSFLYLIYMGGTGPCELMTIIFRRVIKS